MSTVPSARSRLSPPSRGDLLLAVCWFGMGTLFYVTGLQELFSADAPAVALWQRLAVLAVGCVAVAARRRVPLPCLGLAVLAAIIDWTHSPSLPVVLVLAEALHNATLRSSRLVSRAVLAGAAVTTLAITVSAGVVAGNWRVAAVVAVQAGTILLLPVWWALEVRQHRERASAERHSAQQQARIAELDRRAAISAERARMARDLHDVVAGHLSAIALQSEAVLSMADDDPATARTVLASVRANSVQSLAEMRAMIDLLRAEETEETDPHTAAVSMLDPASRSSVSMLDPASRSSVSMLDPASRSSVLMLDPASRSSARLADLGPLLDSARAAGLEVTVQAELAGELPAAVDRTAYRIVQEALTNAAKHAAGSRARIAVRRDGDVVVVEVTNNLTEPTRTGQGTGLVSMRERATALDGTLTAGLTGGSWRVRAVLPTGMSER
jgi:signal transduction histidine kinase